MKQILRGLEPDTYAWKKDVDYRAKPHLYRVEGQQGVLTCEPYKSEIGQFWRFKTHLSLMNHQQRYLRCSMTILNKMILLEQIWRRSFFTWDTQDQGYANHRMVRSGRKKPAVEDLTQEPDAMTCEKPVC